jgi:hypothetical protein
MSAGAARGCRVQKVQPCLYFSHPRGKGEKGKTGCAPFAPCALVGKPRGRTGRGAQTRSRAHPAALQRAHARAREVR